MSDSYILHGEILVDVTLKKTLVNPGVLINQGKIAAIGRYQDIRTSSPEIPVIEMPGHAILPGLIDCHNHLSMDATLPDYPLRLNDPLVRLSLSAVANMRLDLLSGVTTLRSCGDKEFLDIECRKAVEQGLLDGPTLHVAARAIRATHGYGYIGYGYSGSRRLRKAVRENIDAGADFIKFYITGPSKGKSLIRNYFTRNEIETIVDETHKYGLKATAHCVGGVGLDWALESGLDCIEHGYHLNDSQIERLSKRQTWLVLTAGVFLNRKRTDSGIASPSASQKKEVDAVLSKMSQVIRSGINYAVGTDGIHGEMPQEICHLVQLGATPLKAIVASTINGARVCGLDSITGSIELGKSADIVAVKGNPLENIMHIKNVDMVIKGGVVYLNKSASSNSS